MLVVLHKFQQPRLISSVAHLLSNSFHRLRLGIGHPGTAKDVSGFVLTKAPAKEQELIECALDEAVSLSDDMITGKLVQAMNKLNGFKATV